MKQCVTNRMETAKGYFILPRRKGLIYALTIFVGLLTIWHVIGGIFEDQLMHEERLQVANRLNTIGTSLTLAVNQRLTITTSVHSYIEAEILRGVEFSLADPEEKMEVENFVSALYNNTSGIRNIAIAPDGIMEYVYPYKENKSVLGYEPADDDRPNVREEVYRAIQTGKIVLSLPYELIQGGRGLIARKAIYGNEGYWGLVNIVLDLPPLLEEAGLSPMPEGLNLAVADQSGRVFSGSEDVFDGDPITYPIELPEGNWMLAAIPGTGWGVRYRSIMWIYNGLGLATSIAFPLIVYLFINRRERLAYQVEQRTEELAQSNQTLINVLEGIDADVYVADLNDHKILFANKHLRETFKDDLVGKLCYEAFRHEATVCGHCKNEKLLDGNGQPTGVIVWEDFNPLSEKWYKNADRAIRWHNGNYVHLQIATDITEQKHTLAAISESEERYHQAVDNSPNPIFSIDRGGRIQTWNQACERIFHYNQNIIGQHYHTLLKEPEDHANMEALLGRIHFGHSLSNVKMVYQRLDGGECYMVSRIYPLCNHQEEVQGYVFANSDVTEQKRAEDELKRLLQEKDILLAEVHHRVKNNMQVIISLLGLQAGEIEDEILRAAYEESRNRIKSMSLVHEQLYRSKEYARIEIGNYIDQLSTTLFNSYQIEPDRIQMYISAEDVFVDLERAIPCGLLLTELITNSLKYAFPNNANGQIWVKLQPEYENMTLMYRDNGIGLPADLNLENSQSLGLQLVRLLTVHDLRGSVELKNGHKKGVKFLIKFPISGMKGEQKYPA